MKYVKNYRCTLCGKAFDAKEKILTCPVCGDKGILDVEYDYETLKGVLTKEFFLRKMTIIPCGVIVM